jgi:hypothetical protein
MSYIGNNPIQQSFTPGVDYFSGNASTVTFTLSRQTFSVNDIEVVVANVVQNPQTAYTVNFIAGTITFTSPPPTGFNNIYVRYFNRLTQTIAPSAGSVSTSSIQPGAVGVIQLDSASATGNGAVQIPIGNTALRPAGTSGQLRYNNQTNSFEGYGQSGWGSIGGGGGATGGGTDQVFYLNGQTVTTNYTVPSGNNALSAGPIVISNTATITIANGANWTIV